MYEYNAKLIRVIDGDTVELSIDVGFFIHYEVHARLFGIDAPELHSSEPRIRELAQRAKQRILELTEGKNLIIRSHKPDKYGRWLVEIKSDEAPLGTINTQLVLEGLAKEYTGIGPRPEWLV